MNGKQFTAGILFAFVLLTLVLIPIAHQQSGNTYDPWLDYNEDGKIDVNELYPLGASYSSTGNPTKNVTIAGHASKVIRAAVGAAVPPMGGVWSLGVTSVKNYSKVTILINGGGTANAYTLYATDSFMLTTWRVDVVNNFPEQLVKTYDVMNEAINVIVVNNAASSIYIYVDIYLLA